MVRTSYYCLGSQVKWQGSVVQSKGPVSRPIDQHINHFIENNYK